MPSSPAPCHHKEPDVLSPLLGGEASSPGRRTDRDTTDNSVAHGACSTWTEQAGTDKPFPTRQILLLCFVRMMEPIACFSIFPFIAQMVQRNRQLPDSDVGLYSGLIESLFSATQMTVLIFWGRLADRVGRKPILLCSLVGLTIGPVLFCLATTIPEMIFFRCLAGVFSGSDLIIRTMIAENSTPKTQARAFGWFSIGGNLGIFLGPVVGGAFASPATQYPGLFSGIEFLERHPYALPGFVTGLISFTGAITVALFLKETLPREREPQHGRFRWQHQQHQQQSSSQLTLLEIVKAPSVMLVLSLYGHVMLLAFAFTAILPILLYTPVQLGGFGFGPSLISLIMATEAASQALWLVLAFPPLHRRLGNRGLLQACGLAYPLVFAGYILLNQLLRDGSDTARAWFWVACAIESLVGPGVAMSFTAVQLALNDVAPSPQVLGTLNAVALTVSSAVRSIAPGATSALYALGVRSRILDGQLIWVGLIPLAAVLGVTAKWLPKDKTNSGQGAGHA
ncbi:major facilitator superfamily domain-containing protein [Immersiella caudata]|uniref:Major facilitator superfamily domain-containing protein n=1 Tax=Immersiella caudata TaxID=314043 RepID=A0AA39TTL8_9PEZI|nr:major facilitator superfamily domain-containing protein [Immersiella caudata]